jgi:hypothetical protein
MAAISMLSWFQSAWGSQTGLDLAFALVGALMGSVFVLSSWRGSLKGSDLKSDPRIKSLGWALMGFFAAFFGRWEKFLDLDKVDRSQLLLSYALPLLGTAILGVIMVAATIFVSFAAVRRHSSKDYLLESLAPVRDYLFYGYQYYKERYEEVLEEERKSPLSRFRELNAVGSQQLAIEMVAVERYHRNPSDELRDYLCEQILRDICSVVHSYMEIGSNVQLNSNIMVAIPVAQATNDHWDLVRFAYQDRKDYGHLLLLKHYGNLKGKERFALPVVSKTAVSKWQDWVLLGAPETFLREEILVINTQRLDFAKHVPQNIRKEIEGYFAGKGFRSFACLPVPGDGSLRGIVHIESDQDDIFRKSAEIQSEIARVLLPFCALLGQIAG